MENKEILLTENELIAARLMMLEFAIEIIWANNLAHADIQTSAKVKDDFLRLMQKPYGRMTGDREQALKMRAIALQSCEDAKRFVAKVQRREVLIREQIVQAR
jgi:hypothetical protein